VSETPSLTERRRHATRLEIARTAARLFTEHGATGTTAEAIAATAGIGLRTFYRYSRTKEDAVAPLLTVGGDAWRARLAATPAGTPLHRAIEEAIAESLREPSQASGDDDFAWVRGLLAATRDDPALAAVWARVNQDSEARLLPILAALAPDADRRHLRVVAAAATAAIRVALESWALDDAPADDQIPPADLAVRLWRALSVGLTGSEPATP